MPRKKQREQPLFLHVVYSIDYRGANDDIPTFVLMGAEWEQVTRAFAFLAKPNGILKGFSQYEEYACIHRNGKGYRRIAVELREPDYRFASLDAIRLIIESRLKAEHPCEVKFYLNYEQFNNL